MNKNNLLASTCLILTLLLTGCGGGGGADATPQDDSVNGSTTTGDDTLMTNTTDNLTDLAGKFPYSDILSNGQQKFFKVSGGELNEFYVLTLTTNTPGALIYLNIASDASFSHQVKTGSATFTKKATLYVEASESAMYVEVVEGDSDGVDDNYSLNLYRYDEYVGLKDMTGMMPYAGQSGPGSDANQRHPYVVKGITPGAGYLVAVNNMTDNQTITVYGSKKAAVEESPYLCSKYVTTMEWSCTVTAPGDELYVVFTSNLNSTIDYTINVTQQ